jgi:hypothetical protein
MFATWLSKYLSGSRLEWCGENRPPTFLLLITLSGWSYRVWLTFLLSHSFSKLHNARWVWSFLALQCFPPGILLSLLTGRKRSKLSSQERLLSEPWESIQMTSWVPSTLNLACGSASRSPVAAVFTTDGACSQQCQVEGCFGLPLMGDGKLCLN